jgi:hypothetical protein
MQFLAGRVPFEKSDRVTATGSLEAKVFRTMIEAYVYTVGEYSSVFGDGSFRKCTCFLICSERIATPKTAKSDCQGIDHRIDRSAIIFTGWSISPQSIKYFRIVIADCRGDYTVFNRHKNGIWQRWRYVERLL